LSCGQTLISVGQDYSGSSFKSDKPPNLGFYTDVGQYPISASASYVWSGPGILDGQYEWYKIVATIPPSSEVVGEGSPSTPGNDHYSCHKTSYYPTSAEELGYVPWGTPPPSDPNASPNHYYLRIEGSPVVDPGGAEDYWGTSPPGPSVTNGYSFTIVFSEDNPFGIPWAEISPSMLAFDSTDTDEPTLTRIAGGTFDPYDPEGQHGHAWTCLADDKVTTDWGIARVAVAVHRGHLTISVNGGEAIRIARETPITSWNPNYTVTNQQSKFKNKRYYHFTPNETIPGNGFGDDYGNRSTAGSDTDNPIWKMNNTYPYLQDNFASFGKGEAMSSSDLGFAGWIRFAAVKKLTARDDAASLVKKLSRVTPSSGWWTLKNGRQTWTGW
jgi:hypothetical protein